MQGSFGMPLKGGVAAALAAAAFSAPAMAINYVPQAIAQTGLSNGFGPGLGGAFTFDATLANGGALFQSGTPSINYSGQVLFRATTDKAVIGTFTQSMGMFLYSGGTNSPVFMAGDDLPMSPISAHYLPWDNRSRLYNQTAATVFNPITNVFRNDGALLNNYTQIGVKFGSNGQGNLFNLNPQMGQPGAIRDGWRDAGFTALNSDDVPGTSANGVPLKNANVGNNSNTTFLNQAGQYAYQTSLQAGSGVSLPVFSSGLSRNTTTHVSTWNNSGGVMVNLGGTTQLATRSSDMLAQLGNGTNVRLGGGGGSTNNSMVLNDNGIWMQQWNSMQGEGVISTGGTFATGATAAEGAPFFLADAGPNANNAVIITNRGGATTRSAPDGVTGYSTLSGLDIVMRGGAVAPDGTGAPNTWSGVAGVTGTGLRFRQGGGNIGINNLNHVAFNASLSNPAGAAPGTGSLQYNGTASGSLIFTDAGTGVVHLMGGIRGGGQAVGQVYNATGTTPIGAFAGSTWGTAATQNSFGMGSFNINAQDKITFTTSTAITGGEAATPAEAGAPAKGSALFQMGPDEKLCMIARIGDLAPNASSGTPAGVNHIYFSSSFGSVTTNGVGQVAFTATLASPIAGAIIAVPNAGANASAIYCTDLDGSLVKVMQTGDAWVDATGATRYILGLGGLNSTGGQDGRAVSLNDLGDLTFNIAFTNTLGGTTVDGSAVVVAHIPAPGALAVLGLGGLVATRRRRS